jgi:hypothetical protein
MSTFELNKGLVKQRSSQMKLEHEFKIQRMMNKPGVSPKGDGRQQTSDTAAVEEKNNRTVKSVK